MGLKHLQGAVWAVWLVSAVGTLAQEGNPEGCVWNPDDLTLTCPYMMTLEQFCQENPSHEACVWYDLGENVALVIDDEGGGGGGGDGDEDPLEGHQFADIDCRGTACWTLGDWYAFCQSASGNVYVEAYCDDILGRGDLDAAVHEILMAFAQEYPATTCVTGVIIGGTISTFVKRPIIGMEGKKIGWSITTATLAGCAYWADIRD